MSHIVSIKTQLTDLDAIKAAARELGLTFVEHQRTYKWWGESVGDYPLPQGFKKEDLGQCEHAIKVPGTPWEIGVAHTRNPDGTKTNGYTLLCDFYGHRGLPIAKALGGTFIQSGDFEQATGMTFNRFTQLYGVHKAMLEARKRGLMVQRNTTKTGAIQLCVTGM